MPEVQLLGMVKLKLVFQAQPLRAGSAGTGKTVVALHRAVFLARKHPDSRDFRVGAFRGGVRKFFDRVGQQ